MRLSAHGLGQRAPVRPCWLLAALALVLLPACEGVGPEPDLGACGASPGWQFEEEGGSCPAGVSDCAPGLGCVDGLCAPCSSNDDCADTASCGLDGSCGSCGTSADCDAGETCRQGYCMAELPTWDLDLAPEDWERLQDFPYEDTFFPCVLTAGGTEYEEGCAVRSYGSTARNWPKKSLRIRFPEDFDHPGYSRKITLRAEYNDPTFLRNHLAMESFRELIRLPAPRSRHVNLRVNGSVFGVMLELERHGGKWLERNDRDRSQSLYEAERSPVQGGLMPMPDPASYVLIDDDLMYNKKSGDSESYGDLISLIEDVLWEDFLASPSRSETSIERTGEAVDTDTHVSYLALMALLQSRDHVASNYHVGFQRGADGSPRWEVYPTDLDTTFGCVYSDALGTNLCNDLEHEVWWLNGVAPYEGEVGYPSPVWMNLLIHLVLNEPACGDALDQRICAMLASDWWTDGLPRRIDATAEMLRDAVGADPNDLSGDLAAFDASIEDMKAFLPERRAWLESQLLCP